MSKLIAEHILPIQTPGGIHPRSLRSLPTVRNIAVLQSTKAFWEKTGHTFKQDMRVLAKTTDKDFEDFQLILQKAALQNTSITGLIAQARAQGAPAVLTNTANATLTEGI